MNPDSDSTEINNREINSRLTISVAVVLERKMNTHTKWSYPGWQVFAVITGEHLESQNQNMMIHDDGEITRFYWGGMSVNLYKDGCEGYWYNLLSEKPCLFVVCDGEEGDEEIEPVFITANQDEANANMESDDLVLSVPMPVDIRERIERYVTSHYRPEEKKKRKRKNWVEDSLYGQRS